MATILYYFRISGTEGGYYKVGARLNGKWMTELSKAQSAFIRGDNNTNRLKVICKGSQIEVYVNEHQLTTVTDDSFTKGYGGMIVATAEPNPNIAFDNISVRSLD